MTELAKQEYSWHVSQDMATATGPSSPDSVNTTKHKVAQLHNVGAPNDPQVQGRIQEHRCSTGQNCISMVTAAGVHNDG